MCAPPDSRSRNAASRPERRLRVGLLRVFSPRGGGGDNVPPPHLPSPTRHEVVAEAAQARTPRRGRRRDPLGSGAAMPVNGANFDPRLDALYRSGREALGDAEWFDAHTHIGQNDPDGRTATADEILGGLEKAGHQPGPLVAMPRARRYGG